MLYVIAQIESEETVMRRQLASHLLQENGALLTSAIVNACVTGLPSQLLGDVGEILYEMLRTEREVGSRGHAMSCRDVMSCIVPICSAEDVGLAESGAHLAPDDGHRDGDTCPTRRLPPRHQQVPMTSGCLSKQVLIIFFVVLQCY